MEGNEMKTLVLARFAYSDEGVRGKLHLPSGRSFCTLELPWRDNRRKKSCIPTGSYKCSWIRSPKFGPCYQVLDVPKRDGILFHNGNYAGDVDKGFKSHSEGCILIGDNHGILSGQRAVLGSVAARAFFERLMNTESFNLNIVNE